MLFDTDLLGVAAETGWFRLCALGSLGFPLCWVAWSITYNICFHPLSKFPGPIWGKFTRVPFWIHGIMGTQAQLLLVMHEKYGSVVRICPDELSYTDARAWKDIYGHQKGKEENSKATDFQQVLQQQKEHNRVDYVLPRTPN